MSYPQCHVRSVISAVSVFYFNAHSTNNKEDQIDIIFNTLIANIVVVMFTESWISQMNITSNLTYYVNDIVNRTSGTGGAISLN